ncbi:hypothetical protein EI42_05251 [Thermosporothrix hazakensis]|jgi:hypothetical protein|uniref:Uncharacterized protein n=1 Tax=Thermosporothrix hazakensis TaxID=644383 RepID=A0A326U0H3_THEHA|nr:hypothetical protein EI42_05251 [Thermosporothrix hazakensis]
MFHVKHCQLRKRDSGHRELAEMFHVKQAYSSQARGDQNNRVHMRLMWIRSVFSRFACIPGLPLPHAPQCFT